MAVTTRPVLPPANMLAEDYCKEQNLTQAVLRLCSPGCSNTNCFSAQRQQHKPTSSAYNALLSGNRVGALPVNLLGMHCFPRDEEDPNQFCVSMAVAQRGSCYRSLFWTKLECTWESSKFVVPLCPCQIVR